MLNMKNNWQEVEGRLKLELEMEDFMSCVDLINKIAEKAEKMDHHPNITIKNYNQLEIEVYTHSEDGLTEKDFELAEVIDKLRN